MALGFTDAQHTNHDSRARNGIINLSKMRIRCVCFKRHDKLRVSDTKQSNGT